MPSWYSLCLQAQCGFRLCFRWRTSSTDILGRRREELHSSLPEYSVLRPWQEEESLLPELKDLNLRTMEFRFGSPERTFTDTLFTLIGPTSPDRDEDPELDARRVCIMRDVTEQRRAEAGQLDVRVLGVEVLKPLHKLGRNTAIGVRELYYVD